MNKPVKKHVTFYSTTGRYFLGDSQESAQYIFQLPADAPKEINRSYLIDIEKDENYNDNETTALELAEWILSVYEGYWIHSGVKGAKVLVEYLQSIEDEQEALRDAYELEYAKHQVEYWTDRVNELTPSEAI